MPKASYYASYQFERCLNVIRHASTEILSLLHIQVVEVKDPLWFLDQLEQAHINLQGWANVALRLNLNDAEMSDFTLQLRRLQKVVPVYRRGQPVSNNQMIAALRFVSALESLRRKQPLLSFSSLPGDDSGERQEQAQRQMRVLKLTLKALISAVWPDPSTLNNHLTQQFGTGKVRQWLAHSEGDDVLSGMIFTELALLVVDKQSYASYYAALFNSVPALTFLTEPRMTLHLFLEDCRVMRHAIVDNRPLTTTEIALLDNYVQQITTPIQHAYAQGWTSVNPAAFTERDGSECQRFWERIRSKDRALGGDRQPLFDHIERMKKPGLRITEDPAQRIVGALRKMTGTAMVLSGVTSLIMLVSLWMSGQPTTDEPVAEAEKPMIEIPNPSELLPFEKLDKMGIGWDTNSLRAAIDRNDTQVAMLFLQGGMRWQVAWTEQALVSDHDDVLELLLRYRSQMNEPNPCHRFMMTLEHAMVNGEALTPMRKLYLHAFCTTPGVVEHQRDTFLQAKRRAAIKPNARNKKWLKIQASIYHEMA